MLADGTKVTDASLEAAEDAAYQAKFGKYDRALASLLTSATSDEAILDVTISLPLKNDPADRGMSPSASAAHVTALRERLATARAPIESCLRAHGASVNPNIPLIPAIDARVSLAALRLLKDVSGVAAVALNAPKQNHSEWWKPTMRVPELHAAGGSGNGVPVCVREVSSLGPPHVGRAFCDRDMSHPACYRSTC